MGSRLEEKYSWEELSDYVLERVNRKSRKLNKKVFTQFFMERKEVGYQFDSELIGRCYFIWKKLQENRDHFMIISGPEGEGKSWTALKVCSWIDPGFNHQRICFTYEELIRALRVAEKGQSILIDEGAMSLYSREAMTKTTRILTKVFMIMRQKNLFICICIPNFHLLDSYVRDHRCGTLLQIDRRGYYKAYVGHAIKRISIKGRKFKAVSSIRVPLGTFWDGVSNASFPRNIDEGLYNEKKKLHMDKVFEDLDKESDQTLIPSAKLAKKIGVTPESITNMIQRGELVGKKIGNRWYITKDKYDDFSKMENQEIGDLEPINL